MERQVDEYEPVIGLEVHAQLATSSKLFCPCMVSFGAPPNTHVCPTCLGLPGALPVLNERAVRLAVRVALALQCRLDDRSTFARKHYFYPDLPKGYQITQYDRPLARDGRIDIALDPLEERAVPIERLHLEEDAGKLTHVDGGSSRVDLNRAGVALIEIVSAPALRSSHEAAAYLRELRTLLIALGACEGNMERGNLRCDANVSLRRPGGALGTRTEIKNVNSFRFVQKAIDSELDRQHALLASGREVQRETRGWDENTGTTVPLRSKEQSDDYRYFEDPDVPPLALSLAVMERERAQMPELPRDKRRRYVAELGLTAEAAKVLTSHPSVSALFEGAAGLGASVTRVAGFIQTEVMRDLELDGMRAELPLNSEQLAVLARMVEEEVISGTQAKEVYALVRKTSRNVEEVVDELGMRQIADWEELRRVCVEVLARHGAKVESYRAGKRGLLGFFVGEVMKATGGSASPRVTNEVLRELLG